MPSDAASPWSSCSSIPANPSPPRRRREVPAVAPVPLESVVDSGSASGVSLKVEIPSGRLSRSFLGFRWVRRAGHALNWCTGSQTGRRPGSLVSGRARGPRGCSSPTSEDIRTTKESGKSTLGGTGASSAYLTVRDTQQSAAATSCRHPFSGLSGTDQPCSEQCSRASAARHRRSEDRQPVDVRAERGGPLGLRIRCAECENRRSRAREDGGDARVAKGGEQLGGNRCRGQPVLLVQPI